MEEETDIFRRPVWVSVFATTAAIAWGWAYPLIKLGFAEFAITPEMTGSKMVFAGVRFCFAGLVILALALRQKRSFAVSKSGDWWFILVFTMLNTTLHYAFFYFGLSHSVGARAAILNSLGGVRRGDFRLRLLPERPFQCPQGCRVYSRFHGYHGSQHGQ